MEIGGFPPELAATTRFDDAALTRAFPFLRRFLLSALRDRARAWPLVEAERLELPFLTDGALWSFRLSDPARGAAGEPARRHREIWMFWVAGAPVVVDFTDACFHAAAQLGHLPGRSLDATQWRAVGAVYFATSHRRRRHQLLAVGLSEHDRPAGLDDAAWRDALARVRQVAELGAAFRRFPVLDQRAGAIRVVQLAPDLTDGAVETLLESPSLRGDPGQRWVGDAEAAWHFGASPGLRMSIAMRRAERHQQLREAIDRYRAWRPAGFDGDVAAVDRHARQLFDSRPPAHHWREIFPEGDAADAAEAECLLKVLHERQPDYAVPEDCLSGNHRFRHDARRCPIKIRRRMLPFYPAHRLYEIIDRRDGRPRRTLLLFACETAALPAEIDALIPLDGKSNTHYMLNEAYGISLTPDAVPEYLTFFCDTLSGGDGLFHPVESEAHVRWRGLAEPQRAAIADIAAPIRIWPMRDDGAYVADGLLTYAGALFHAEFRVTPDGVVRMADDQPLTDRLDVAPEIFISKTHFFLRPPNGFRAPDRWLRHSSLGAGA